MRVLCKACSEGRPHEQHDHSNLDTGWQAKRRIGLASKNAAAVTGLLERWAARGDGRRIESVDP
jgi:hypothetical protein